MIAIDIGNSRIKWAHFSDDKLLSKGGFEYTTESLASSLDELSVENENQAIWISCVGAAAVKNEVEQYYLSRGDDVTFVKTASQQLGVTNGYAQPEKLGVDRWLAMLAAYHLKNRRYDHGVCVIDAGTALTVDVMNEKGHHQGGWIIPGWRTMLNSLVHSTENLRMESARPVSKSYTLADKTDLAMENGVSLVLLNGLSGILESLEKQWGDKLDIVVTGGDSAWLVSQLNRSLIHEPELVLDGLLQVYKASLT